MTDTQKPASVADLAKFDAAIAAAEKAAVTA